MGQAVRCCPTTAKRTALEPGRVQLEFTDQRTAKKSEVRAVTRSALRRGKFPPRCNRAGAHALAGCSYLLCGRPATFPIRSPPRRAANGAAPLSPRGARLAEVATPFRFQPGLRYRCDPACASLRNHHDGIRHVPQILAIPPQETQRLTSKAAGSD